VRQFGDEKDRIVPFVRRATDYGTQSSRRESLAIQVKVLGQDARIPGAPRSSHKTGDQVGKDSRQNQLSPSFPSAELEDAADFLQVSRQGDRAGDDVEQDVPLPRASPTLSRAYYHQRTWAQDFPQTLVSVAAEPKLNGDLFDLNA
jgi:hypothetical protein